MEIYRLPANRSAVKQDRSRNFTIQRLYKTPRLVARDYFHLIRNEIHSLSLNHGRLDKLLPITFLFLLKINQI